MDKPDQPDALLPLALLAEVESRATAEPFCKRTPLEAGARMFERRKLHSLPEGESIRDLTICGGRA